MHFALAGLVATTSIAVAAPASATSDTLAWNKVRGVDAPTACAPGEDPYLHWVLTPGGKTKVPTAGTSLTVVDGRQTQTVNAQREGNGMGAIHFYTDYFDPAEIDSAVASLGGASAKGAHLTISSGCFGPVVTPPPTDVLPCDVSTSATGGAGTTTNVHEVGATSGVLTFYADAWGMPDRFQVIYEGTVLHDETLGSDNQYYDPDHDLGSPSVDPVAAKTYTIPFSGTSSQVTVVVNGGADGTVWDYRISCAAPAV